MIGDLGSAILYIFQPWPLFFLVLGTWLGIFVGAVPGLTGGMLISLVIPLTFYMDSTMALVLMVAMYVGSVSGGLISAMLLRMPGTPSSLMTTFDGHPMAARGEAQRALSLGIGASLAGGMIAGFFLVVLSPPLSKWALQFGPWEYFTMVLMAIVLIATLSQGSLLKGLLAGFLGMMFAMPGFNDSDGQLRLTFGFSELSAGFQLLPMLLGIFVMSQVIKDALEIDRQPEAVKLAGARVRIGWKKWRRHATNIVRSSVIGTWIGILPGVGASVSAMVAYGVAKNVSDTPERFGTGCEEGIVASEASNNANVGGALIPLITMGIPGSPIDAILLSALIMHNIQPGPLLFLTNGDFVWALIAAYLVANVLMFFTMKYSVGILSKVVTVDRAVLLPLIFVCCVVGAFALSNRIFDVWVVVAFGLVGFVMERAKVPLGPFVIGFVLAPLFETELRAGLQTSGSFMGLFSRPIATAFFLAAVAMLFWPMIQGWRRRDRDAAGLDTSMD
ncbi:tripartite tricarboxylate transporter permease [Sulfitobacter sp. D35]|uniref:tripartite tricarboxylate transporter permease n=1 Tax=Sulfitobacter sp. D35 TaxID=3083252 RepID=UPI00296F9726|nr:tripartite tricarboxylate transporter permease [Sulfitobacter sp. D35]MDW4499332.1 tripartite tricarboxylate transporter permease [Sulfitobacter sp. D35]